MNEFDELLGEEVDQRSEKAILNDTLKRLSALPESLFFRNNTGQAWQGSRLRLKPGQNFRFESGMVVLRAARPVKFGLEGSGDIMGSLDGVPVAVEVKDRRGRQRTTQSFFEAAWRKAGGIYILARSASQAESLLRQAVSRIRPAKG